MKRSIRTTGAVAAATLALCVGIASANTKTVTDAQNDQGDGTLDLKSATHGHADGKLVHKVVTYGNFGSDRAGTISVSITVGSKFYSVSKYGLWDQDAQETKPITVKRPTNNSIKFIFSKRQIGNPGSYKWFAQAVPPFPCLVCPDFLPDQSTTAEIKVTHRL